MKIREFPLEESSRVPACVSTCPAGARSFGDFSDESSNVSTLVKERGGYALMPEQDCQPINRYLPPRPKQYQQEKQTPPLTEVESNTDKLLSRWAEKLAQNG